MDGTGAVHLRTALRKELANLYSAVSGCPTALRNFLYTAGTDSWVELLGE